MLFSYLVNLSIDVFLLFDILDFDLIDLYLLYDLSLESDFEPDLFDFNFLPDLD